MAKPYTKALTVLKSTLSIDVIPDDKTSPEEARAIQKGIRIGACSLVAQMFGKDLKQVYRDAGIN
jgi:hypothetical protein